MKNILIALNADAIDVQAIDFACYLANISGSKLTGVFLENLSVEERPFLNKDYGMPYLEWKADESIPEIKEKKINTESGIRLFKSACRKRQVSCIVHRDRGIPAEEMIAESRFADIVVTDAATSFKKIFEGSPTSFVKDLLKKAECPVIIAPEKFDFIERIVFAYDGTASAVFAMKQFTYLFPEFADKNITVFHVNENHEWTKEEKDKLSGWLKHHFSAVGFETVSGDPTYELLSFLLLKKNVFIVMGAYGRSAVSRFFRKSSADILTKIITQPMFIAHH